MAGIVDRVKNILLSPKTEWPVIDAESGDTKEVFTYAAILAAIPAVIGVVLGLVISSLVPLGLPFLLISAILGYLLTFVIIYLLAMVTDALAPTFNGEKHMPSALKLVTYAYTPIWVASIFAFIPLIGFLLIIAGIVYTVYLLYLGVPVLMRAPQDKAVGYTIVMIICGIVIAVVLNLVVFGIVGAVLLR